MADPRSGLVQSSGGAHTSSTPSSNDAVASGELTSTQAGVSTPDAIAVPTEPPAAKVAVQQLNVALPDEQTSTPQPSPKPLLSLATPNSAGRNTTEHFGSARSTSANRQSIVAALAATGPASTAQSRTATVVTVESPASTYSDSDADAAGQRLVPKAFGAPLVPSNALLDVASDVLDWVGVNPFVSDDPLAPAQSPALLAVLAWARRQNHLKLVDGTPSIVETTTQSGQTVGGVVTDDAGLSALATDNVVLAAVAVAPPAFVQVNSAVPQTNQSSVSVTYTGAQTAGDTNILAIGWNNATSNITSVTDSAGNTYQQAVPTARGTGLSQAIYYAKNIKTAPAGTNTVTVTFNTATPYVDIRATEYSGLDPNTPFEVGTSASGTSTTANSGTVTTTAPGLIFGAGMTTGSFTTAATGFTTRVITNPDADIAQDRTVTTPGAYTASASLGGSAAWIMQIATFKAAAGGDTTAPTVSITDPPGGTVSGTFAISATATDNAGVAGVQFRVDGTAIGAEDTTSPYSATLNTIPLANGTHTLTAVARDINGNTATSAPVTITVNNVDTSAPAVSVTAPTGTVSGTVTISATATDNAGVAGVQFRVDGTAIGAQDTTSPYNATWNTTTATNGTHTLTAVATDINGNTATSAPITITVNNVAVAPPAFVQVNSAVPQTNQSSVSVTYTGAQTAGDTNILAIGWNNATSNITSVTDSAGNTYQQAVPTARGTGLSQAIYYAKNIKTAPAGTNTVTVTFNTATPYVDIRATEYSGLDPNTPFEVGTSASGTSTTANSGTVTTTAPGLIFGAGMTTGSFTTAATGFTTRVITNPDADIAQDRTVTTPGAYTASASLGGSAAWIMQIATFKAAAGGDTTAPTVSITDPPGGTVSGTFAISATATDNAGVAGVQFRVDGTAIGAEDTTSPYSATLNTIPLANGTHTLTAVARDINGNTATSAPVTITVNNVDTSAPAVSVTAPTGTVSGTVTISATATDNAGVAGVQFRVDGTAIGAQDTTSPYNATWNTTTATNGTHTLTAVATDINGNTATSAPITITVNNVATGQFENEVLATGLDLPTAIKFLPDGRMLVAELGGKIKVLPAPYTQADPTPFLQLTNVGNADDGIVAQQGIYDFALDPNFATNHYYYVTYTARTPNRDRLSRFTANADLTGTVPGSEMVIYQDPQNADTEHHGGAVVFGNDGKLYLTTGDHFQGTPSQDLTSPRGKILRFNPDGTVPTDNPFYDGSGPNYDAVWALGLRNPYRAYYDVPTSRLLIGDVGGNVASTAMEELDLGVRGANYGWPNVEGTTANPAYTNPIFAYPHLGRDASITGGFVYHGDQFPNTYEGSYFYGDYAQNTIKRLTFDANGNVNGVFNFEPADGSADGSTGDIVYLTEGPEGALYYIDLGVSDTTGQVGVSKIHRISFTGANQPPVARASATPSTGPVPLTVNFSSTGSSDPEGQPLTYSWDFGDHTASTLANPTHIYNTAGPYTVRLTLSDGVNSTISSPLTVNAGTKPTVSIVAPTGATTFRAGDVISFAGTATDAEDGTLPASAYTWNIDFLHDTHVHPGTPITGVTSGTFTIPTSGHDFDDLTRYQVTVTVTDSTGLQSSSSVSIFPQKVDLTFGATPAGANVYLDGIAHPTPFVYNDLIGFSHTISAPDQTINGTPYKFVSWSGGGAQTHTITVPDANQTYTATFAAVAVAPPAFVQVNSAVPQTNQSSVSVTYTGAQTAGDTNILAIGWNNATSNITSVTDSAGNTYQQAVPTARGTGLSQAIYYAKNIKTAPAGTNTVTVTFNTATPYVDIRATEYSGLDPNTPFEVGTSASGTSTTANSGTVTTTAPGLIFGAGMTTGSFTTAATGFTTRVITNPDADIAQDRTVTTPGAYTASASLGGSAAWIMQIATFKAAAGGDTTAPTVSITDPPGGTVSGTFAISATATDNAGVAGVQFRVDGTAIGAEDTTSPYSATLNTIPLANGTHTLTAVARDINGNTATSAPVTITVNNVDTSAPAVSVTAPTGTVSGTVTISATATDNAGVAGVQFRVDGTAIGAQDTTSPYNATWNTTTATNGTHTLTAVATDINGNTATSAPITITVNNVAVAPPAFVQVNSAVPQTNQSSVSVTYTGAQTAGDTNILAIGWNNATSNITSVTDSAGNTYQQAVPTARGTGLSQAIYYAKNIKTAPAGTNTVTVTFNTATPYVDIRATEYSGLDPNTPFEVGTSASGTSTTANSGTVTTTAPGLIFGAGMTTGSFTTAATGFTTRVITNPDADIAQDRTVTTPGAYTASASLGGSAAWIMQIATFKAAAGLVV